MLNKIKALKIKAYKEQTPEGNIAKDAYNSVIASIQTAQGRMDNSSEFVITDAFVIDAVKKEIKVFREAASSSAEVLKGYELKAQVLEKLLPRQLNKEDLKELLLKFEGNKNPKAFMSFLDEQGFAGSYNKGEAASLVLGK